MAMAVADKSSKEHGLGMGFCALDSRSCYFGLTGQNMNSVWCSFMLNQNLRRLKMRYYLQPTPIVTTIEAQTDPYGSSRLTLRESGALM